MIPSACAESIREYTPSEDVLINPLMGNVRWAEDLSPQSQPATLVYANLTWAELEPEEGRYAFEEMEERLHFREWRDQGCHMILRFVMDIPTGKPHRDIPDWLAERISGSSYSTAYGKGWCPDYESPSLIAAHRNILKALGDRYDQDPFVSFVEIGSLGHWGEWHVHDDAGSMPSADTWNLYIHHYLSAFSETHLMMRRPFQVNSTHPLGLYNDAAGDFSATLTWLDWIENGGDYEGRKNELTPMPEAWKTAPIGGELTTSVSPETLLLDGEAQAALFRLCHVSWIGPNSFTGVTDHHAQYYLNAILKSIGYRLRVSRSTFTGHTFSFTIVNDGIAPFYYPWPVVLCVSGTDNQQHLIQTGLDLRNVLPDSSILVECLLPEDVQQVAIGILDPMTNQPAVKLAMETPEENGWHILWP